MNASMNLHKVTGVTISHKRAEGTDTEWLDITCRTAEGEFRLALFQRGEGIPSLSVNTEIPSE